MKQVTIGNRNVPAIIQGCMRIGNLDTKSLQNLIEKQLESGVNFWDHADIYGGSTCETIFGETLHQMPGMRDKLILQSKCGIRPGAFTCYDFSKAHIIRSVETSLRRLQTDRSLRLKVPLPVLHPVSHIAFRRQSEILHLL